MLLNASVREKAKKKDAKRARRSGSIPAVMYAPGKENKLLQVSARDFAALLRAIPAAHLPTTQIELDIGGSKMKVLVKDIQYHPTTYDVIHLDFEELSNDVPVNVNVPINFLGAMDCVGVKLGGVLRQVIRYVRVHCLPKAMPASFDIDVKHLHIGQSMRLSELTIPEGVRLLAQPREVMVIIAKK